MKRIACFFLIISLLAVLPGCSAWDETGYSSLEGRFIRVENGTALLVRQDLGRSESLLVIRPYEDRTDAFDTCQTGDLIRILFTQIRSGEDGQAYTEVFDWKKVRSGTEVDIPPAFRAQAAERFSN